MSALEKMWANDKAQGDTESDQRRGDSASVMRPPYIIYFGDAAAQGYAKTGLGLIEWRRELCIGQFRSPGCGVDGGLPDMTIAEAVEAGAKSFVIGIASAGGAIPERWVNDLAAAARAGLDIVSGMHARLSAFPAIVAAARESGVRLVDVRTPPENLLIGTGAKRPGKRLLTVGADCAVGKKYSALALEREMRARGWDADFRATGQTGVMIAGSGFAIDSVVSDFLSGAAEVLSPAADESHWDVIEGQGALSHPSFAGVSLGLLHGSQPDALVMCLDPTRKNHLGTERAQSYAIPGLRECLELNLLHSRRVNPSARFVGVCVNSRALGAGERTAILEKYRALTGLPVVDPLIDGVGPVIDRLETEFPR
ncbi:MAG: DUF1611 domain-containing protein [Amphiplicatus sp.]